MYRIAIDDERDVYMASSIGKKVAEEFGLDKIQQTKLVVSIMELARNIIYYAVKGEIFITPFPDYGIEILAIDHGPGIKEIEKVLKSEIRSKKGLGLGLSGVQRLMDEFEITSKENIGTRIRAVKWLNERQGNHH
ncbi:anti-sigma regulatory factor [Bacillus smithii]|uniref:anti-sigma regulatory factor n=1 Tax=Bacillus smithii TaxID=1479 RepID=UPI002E1AB36C|nr:anti-sigma regulatory factor [Bacillus smithii]MED1456811.1 anti-sigma regulatory factor [Bacillus smithii]